MIVRRSCRFLYEHSPSTGFLRILKKLLTILRRLKFYRDSVHLPSILSVPAIIFSGELQFSSTSFHVTLLCSPSRFYLQVYIFYCVPNYIVYFSLFCFCLFCCVSKVEEIWKQLTILSSFFHVYFFYFYCAITFNFILVFNFILCILLHIYWKFYLCTYIEYNL